jgi:predicted RNase H-like HicB family nuclease
MDPVLQESPMSEITTTARAETAAPPVIIEVVVRIHAVAIREAGGRYSVAVPALPGCVTQADNIEGIQANVIEAVEGWLGASHDLHKDEAVRDMLG